MPAQRERTQSFSVSLPPELSKYYDDKRKELGTGGFAKVILAEHIATRETVAIKVMNKQHLAKKVRLSYFHRHCSIYILT